MKGSCHLPDKHREAAQKQLAMVLQQWNGMEPAAQLNDLINLLLANFRKKVLTLKAKVENTLDNFQAMMEPVTRIDIEQQQHGTTIQG